jgi:hypothetical protein
MKPDALSNALVGSPCPSSGCDYNSHMGIMPRRISPQQVSRTPLEFTYEHSAPWQAACNLSFCFQWLCVADAQACQATCSADALARCCSGTLPQSEHSLQLSVVAVDRTCGDHLRMGDPQVPECCVLPAVPEPP